MYKLILAFRYMFKKRISYMAFLAVALCVFIVVIVMTVMRGLVGDFKRKNHEFVGDCVVSSESLVGFAYYEEFIKILEGQDYIEAVSPVIKGFALLSPNWTEDSFGIEIMGFDAARHSRVTGFGKTLHFRKNEPSKAFEPLYNQQLLGCVFGIDKRLVRDVKGKYEHGQRPSEDSFTISCVPLTAKGALAKAGAGIISTKTFYFSDTSQTGIARVDGAMVYLPFEQAQLLSGMGGMEKRVNAIHIKLEEGVRLDDGRDKVGFLWSRFVEGKRGESKADLLDKVTVQSWEEYRRPFIAAMEKEHTMLIMMFSLVGITTVFVIFVVFYMIICHKSKDIGILKSVGVSNINIYNLFSGFAFLVGILGSIVGMVLGWLFLRKINVIEDLLFERFGFQLWDRSIYAIGEIPNRLEFDSLMVIFVSAIFVCLTGAFAASWQGARLEPVESLQVSQL